MKKIAIGMLMLSSVTVQADWPVLIMPTEEYVATPTPRAQHPGTQYRYSIECQEERMKYYESLRRARDGELRYKSPEFPTERCK